VRQLCIHRTRIAQQRKKNGAGISLSKTIKRQAFNKDRKRRLTATTKPNGRKSTSLIDFSLPPQTPPRSSSAARSNAPAAAAAARPDVVRVGGHVVALSGAAGADQGSEDVGIVHHDSLSDVSNDNGSVDSDTQRLSGDESDQGEQDLPRVDDAAAPQQSRSRKSPDSPSLTALSISAAVEATPLHSATGGTCAAGEGWDSLSPFADVDAASASTTDGGGGEGRIALLPLDGLLFHDIPMY
jgi:hypothetical protein